MVTIDELALQAEKVGFGFRRRREFAAAEQIYLGALEAQNISENVQARILARIADVRRLPGDFVGAQEAIDSGYELTDLTGLAYAMLGDQQFLIWEAQDINQDDALNVISGVVGLLDDLIEEDGEDASMAKALYSGACNKLARGAMTVGNSEYSVIPLLEKAVQMAEEVGNPVSSYNALMNLGKMYMLEENFVKADSAYEEAEERLTFAEGDVEPHHKTLSLHLAWLGLSEGDYSSAEAHLTEFVVWANTDKAEEGYLRSLGSPKKGVFGKFVKPLYDSLVASGEMEAIRGMKTLDPKMASYFA